MTKQRIDEMKKFIQLAEGTWALPQSEEHYQMLANFLFGGGPRLNASDMREALYNIYGDDELYDMLDELEDTNKSAEARPYVIDWIKNNDQVTYKNLYSIGKAQTFEAIHTGRKGGKHSIDLSGPEGNAFVLLGYVQNLGKQLSWDSDRIRAVQQEMQSGDYENLLSVFDREFGDYVDLYRGQDDAIDEGIGDKVGSWFMNKGAEQIIKAIDLRGHMVVVSEILNMPQKKQDNIVQGARHYLKTKGHHAGLQKMVDMVSHSAEDELQEDFRSDSFNPKHQAVQNRENARRDRAFRELERRQNAKTAKAAQNRAVAQIMMDTIGEVFPDGDPFDFILPKLRKMGIREYDAMTYLDRAARSIGYKSYHNALDLMHRQYYADNPELAEGKWDYPDYMKGKGNAEAGTLRSKREGRKEWRKKQKAEQHKKRMRGELDESDQNATGSPEFFVAIHDGEDFWVGRLEKEGGKWYESTVFGNAGYGFGGKNYMGYLTRDDLMTWLHKDYHVVLGPFENEYDAEMAMDKLRGDEDGEGYFESVTLSKIADSVLREAAVPTDEEKYEEALSLAYEVLEERPEANQIAVLKKAARKVGVPPNEVMGFFTWLDEQGLYTHPKFLESVDADESEDDDRIIDVGDEEDFEDLSLPYNWTDDESLDDEYKKGLRFD